MISTLTISARAALLALATATLTFTGPAAAQDKKDAPKTDAKPSAKPDPKPDPKPGEAKLKPQHALVMHGKPKYGPDFKHFDYVNPEAPKGGLFLIGEIGTFNTLNPYALRANADVWIARLVHGHLMTRSDDEAFSMYPWIAKSVTMAKDRTWIEFHLNPKAKFSDGTPVTPEDVIFSYKIIITKGRPSLRSYFADVKQVMKTGPHSVKFIFKGTGENRELPLIVAGDLPILSKAFWSKVSFDNNTLKPPVASGPYFISAVNPGSSVTYKLVPNYWARNLPALKGIYNFGVVRSVYFRDANVARASLIGGQFDYRYENSASGWATGYDVGDANKGLLKKWQVPHQRTQGMQGFVFNTRNPLFKDWRVRRALALVYDFETANKSLFHSQYKRTFSYFDNSELASRGLPKGDELKLLEKYKGQIPDSVFTTEYSLPKYKNGRMRKGIRAAFKLLKAAGWKIKDRKLVNAKTGAPFEFTLLLVSPAFERIALPYKNGLARLGIDMRVRLVSQSEYIKQVLTFKFDMIVGGWGQSLSPGNEQRANWSRHAAKTPYSRNFTGVSNKAVDALVELIITAPDRKTLVTRVRALDRVLLHMHLAVPQWHIGYDRLVYWDKFGIPKKTTIRGTRLETWWVDPKKAAALKAKKPITSLTIKP